MNKKLARILIPLSITLCFWLICYSKTGFNLLPYTIYYSISENGNHETEFIEAFDILAGIILFLISFILINRGSSSKRLDK